MHCDTITCTLCCIRGYDSAWKYAGNGDYKPVSVFCNYVIRLQRVDARRGADVEGDILR